MITLSLSGSLVPFLKAIHLKAYGAHVNPKKCATPPTCACGAVHPCPATN